METLDEIPAHVWKGLPDCLSLRPSAINQSRVGEYMMGLSNSVNKIEFEC